MRSVHLPRTYSTVTRDQTRLTSWCINNKRFVIITHGHLTMNGICSLFFAVLFLIKPSPQACRKPPQPPCRPSMQETARAWPAPPAASGEGLGLQSWYGTRGGCGTRRSDAPPPPARRASRRGTRRPRRRPAEGLNEARSEEESRHGRKGSSRGLQDTCASSSSTGWRSSAAGGGRSRARSGASAACSRRCAASAWPLACTTSGDVSGAPPPAS